ncbi:MAG: phytanoyl-CoA dioxygenase family protein [Bdellovibrionales bacterium]
MLPWFMMHNAYDYVALNPPAPEIREYVDQFLLDGWAVVKQGVPRDFALEMNDYYYRVKQANEELVSPYKNQYGCLQRVVNLHHVYPKLLELFTRNRISLMLQDYLFAAPTAVYTSLTFEQGSEQNFHRDTPVFDTNPPFYYFGMWIPLEDVDADNGPLRAYKGGHLVPDVNRYEIAKQFFPDLRDVPSSDHPGLWNTYQDALAKRCEEMGLPIVPIHVQAGDTVIWHPQLPHGGSPQKDKSRTRLSFLMHTTPPNMPVYHMDGFFNPYKEKANRAPWPYVPFGEGRYYAYHGPKIDMGHNGILPATDFRKVA